MLKLTDFEKEVYNFIRIKGESRISNIPKMMWGAIPKLKNAGLVKTYKKPTTPWSSKKHTFVKVLKQVDF